ncbi:MAG: lipid-A-disaccharide synthase N-terminal domain-containing protein [Halioglobus sp.]|nr:lipid-A-disaccharide synthase N-terminal domain-containing protein [Halioglobus sp.]
MDILHIQHGWEAAWVAVGLAGQLLFFARMLIQWLISEAHHQSIVPPIFWWCSLGGALLLLCYFLWRRDPIGILGQAFGFLVYARNLTFIYAGASRGRPGPGV